jgi:hypothetical protein
MATLRKEQGDGSPMPKKTGTAIEFIMQTLRQHPDRELRIADLFDHCEGKFTKENMTNALTRAMEKGLVVRASDSDRSSWWAISAEGLTGTARAPVVDKSVDLERAKVTPPIKVNVITSGRY